MGEPSRYICCSYLPAASHANRYTTTISARQGVECGETKFIFFISVKWRYRSSIFLTLVTSHPVRTTDCGLVLKCRNIPFWNGDNIEIDPMKELQEWGIEFSQSTMKMDYIFLKLKSQISWKIHNLCAVHQEESSSWQLSSRNGEKFIGWTKVMPEKLEWMTIKVKISESELATSVMIY